MIRLEIGKANTAVLTLSEMETGGNGTFLLNLTCAQSDFAIGGIPLADLSSRQDRYNEFIIVPTPLISGLAVAEDTTLEAGAYYFVDGDITLADGVTLTIPISTTVVLSLEYDVVLGAGASVDGEIAYTESLESNKEWFMSSGEISSPATFVFGLFPGYWDYKAYSTDEVTLLETGKALVQGGAPVVTEYSVTQTNTIYQP